MARCCANAGSGKRDPDRLRTSTRSRISILGVCEDGSYKIVEDLRLGCDVARIVRVHVPGGELVERGGLLVGQMQHVAVGRGAGLLQHLLEHVRKVLGSADGVVLFSGDGEIHELILGPSESPATFLERQRMLRTGIKTRYWVDRGDTGVGLARAASQKALDKAGLEPKDLDCIIYCTCTPDHFEPGNGVFLQRELGLTDIPAVDVRNQCSGFIYGLSIADAWIRTGQYKRILLVGAEVHSRGLDKTTRGRDTAVLFGDGAGAAVLAPVDDDGRGVLSTHIFADGRYAEKLWVDGPGLAHDPYVSVAMLEQGLHRAVMEGRDVFKFASVKMPESVAIALKANGLAPADITLLVPHQANQRIIEMVQKATGLRDDQVYSNIQKYGNTTAASIPIALDEALAEGRLKHGDLLVLTAFGSGFTWGSAAIRW